jgi:hypothetical protein
MESQRRGIGAAILLWLPIGISIGALIWSVYSPLILQERTTARDAFLSGQRDMYRHAIELTGRISQKVLAGKDPDPDWQNYLALLRGEGIVFSDTLVSDALYAFRDTYQKDPKAVIGKIDEAGELVAACIYSSLSITAHIPDPQERGKLCHTLLSK